VITYFDTSALVKTIVAEPDTDTAMDLWNSSDVRLTSLITYAEVRAALAAATRARRLVGRARTAAHVALDDRWQELSGAAVSDDVVHLAGDLSDRIGLRGYDAVHLATALLAGPTDVVFATWDVALADAAPDAGLLTAGG
jgi:predicted nucleic acid-binding protein